MAQFKTRARALDLLGRQQIAGIPTAINELIKNAYDAYADHFDASYLRPKGMLVLRDDGLGMSRTDFENRWLTLGTESKTKGERGRLPLDKDKPVRPITGEKGIGRLAIASIGSQVLILTRPKYGENKSIVGCFINWELFEIPGVNLEDITIPVMEFDVFPRETEIRELTQVVGATLHALYESNKITKNRYERLARTIDSFVFDPFLLARELGGPFGLSGDNSGTHFYISPVSEMFEQDLERSKDSDEATKMEKMLLRILVMLQVDHLNNLISM